MSHQLIDHSPDLKRLRNEGYDIEVRGTYLLVKDVPYVNGNTEIKLGTLVSDLNLVGDVTTTPNTHIVYFEGEYPCHKDGTPIEQIRHQTATKELDSDLVVNHSFSNKPAAGYTDYYEKMSRYVDILASPARSINPSVTAKTFPVIEATADESVFHYRDTASSRGEITVVTRKLELGKIGIVGLGGTGSYVLDLVAKTPVREIHLFDGDKFSQHNAFRSPSAPSIEELKQRPQKVDYFKDIYSKIHRNIVVHDYYVDASNVEELQGMDFVFLCLDSGLGRKPIVEKLEELGTPFVDTGMGILLVDEALTGQLRVTTSSVQQRDHVRGKNRIPFTDADVDEEYTRNIQIADLNALSAALAVVKLKKLYGFYIDLEHEHHAVYVISGNNIVNEDQI